MKMDENGTEPAEAEPHLNDSVNGKKPDRLSSDGPATLSASSDGGIRGPKKETTRIVVMIKRETETVRYFDENNVQVGTSKMVSMNEINEGPMDKKVVEEPCSMAELEEIRLETQNVLEVTGDVQTDSKRISPFVQEPSDIDTQSLSGNDVATARRTRGRARALLSEDEDEARPSKPAPTPRGRRSTKPPVNEEFPNSTYVMAKYSDNVFYPAIVVKKERSANMYTVEFSDSKEQMSVHKSALLKPKEWLTAERDVMVKTGKGADGGTYVDGRIVRVVAQEGKAPRYVVDVDGEENEFKLTEIAISDDAILKDKLNHLDEKKQADGASGSSSGTHAQNDKEIGKGSIVMTQWKDMRFYPATVLNVKQAEGVYEVQFFDQVKDLCSIAKSHRLEDVIVPGAIIDHQVDQDEFVPAPIKSIVGSGGDLKVYYKPPDSVSEKPLKYAIQQLAMTEDNIKKILRGERAEESPPKVASAEPEKRTSVAGTSRGTSSKRNAKPEVVDLEEEQEKAAEPKEYRIGSHVFHDGEPVFGKWEDGRWYAAKIRAPRQSKIGIEWLENEQRNFIDPNDVVRARDVLQKGVKVNVISKKGDYYDEFLFEMFNEDSESHIVKAKKGSMIEKPFSDMMVHDEVVKHFRKKPKASVTGIKQESAPEAPKTTPRKRTRSPSEEVQTIEKPKPKRGRPSSALQEVREPSPVNVQLFTSCSFIVTSGSERDPSFDRDAINRTIQENGGVLLQSFDDLNKAGGKKYLISPTSCRTAKYLQCLAAGIPCVKHNWVLDSVAEKKLMDIAKYRLPTGKASSTGEMIKWKERKALLDTMRIGLHGGSNFLNTWTPALKAAKAVPINVTDSGKLDRFDVVIAEEAVEPKMLNVCEEKGIPMVTVEWIIQTLIMGQKQPYESFSVVDTTGESMDTSQRH